MRLPTDAERRYLTPLHSLAHELWQCHFSAITCKSSGYVKIILRRSFGAGSLIAKRRGRAQPISIRTDLQDGQLSAGLTERLWGIDRGALRTCRERHKALERFIREHDAVLAGTNIK